MKHAYIITPYGYARVEVLARRGDWAVTEHNGLCAITHLPTGARVTNLPADKRAPLMDAMHELSQLPRFDLQQFDVHAPGVKAVLKKHGVWNRRETGHTVEQFGKRSAGGSKRTEAAS